MSLLTVLNAMDLSEDLKNEILGIISTAYGSVDSAIAAANYGANVGDGQVSFFWAGRTQEEEGRSFNQVISVDWNRNRNFGDSAFNCLRATT